MSETTVTTGHGQSGASTGQALLEMLARLGFATHGGIGAAEFDVMHEAVGVQRQRLLFEE